MRVLIVAASKHGATSEIAAAIARTLADSGIDAHVELAADASGVERYDAVVLGSAVYAGRWLKSARQFAARHAEALAARPVWLFSSGPTGPPDPVKDWEPQDVAELRSWLEPRGHRVFAGELDTGRLGLAERAIVRALHAPAGDFRDWDAVTAWSGQIADELTPRREETADAAGP
jgi:menaquinone-dependent protoporphyrinogen oxidase